jgi:hypothetical protein
VMEEQPSNEKAAAKATMRFAAAIFRIMIPPTLICYFACQME